MSIHPIRSGLMVSEAEPSITRKDVEHIAHLARIELSAEEKDQYERELSAILAFIKKLNEVPTDGVTPASGGTTLVNALRPDEVIDTVLEGRAEILHKMLPEKERGFTKVRAVFE